MLSKITRTTGQSARHVRACWARWICTSSPRQSFRRPATTRRDSQSALIHNPSSDSRWADRRPRQSLPTLWSTLWRARPRNGHDFYCRNARPRMAQRCDRVINELIDGQLAPGFYNHGGDLMGKLTQRMSTFLLPTSVCLAWLNLLRNEVAAVCFRYWSSPLPYLLTSAGGYGLYAYESLKGIDRAWYWSSHLGTPGYFEQDEDMPLNVVLDNVQALTKSIIGDSDVRGVQPRVYFSDGPQWR